MAVFALNDVEIWVGGAVLECVSNQATLTAEADELDATTWCASGWDIPIAGKRKTELDVSGPADFAAPAGATSTALVDNQLGGTLGTAYPWSVVPIGPNAGAVAYFSSGPFRGYTPLDGQTGELATWNGKWSGQNPLVRGTLADVQTVSATGNGTGYQLGLVGTGQRIWAAVHVLTAGGTTPSFQWVLESDDNSGFTTPTSRIVGAAYNARGADFASLVGPIATDNWWRFRWVVAGTTPSFQIRTVFGIQ